MKKNPILKISEIAKDAEKSPDFIKGILSTTKDFSINGNLILLNRRGIERCLVCGENIFNQAQEIKLSLSEKELEKYQVNTDPNTPKIIQSSYDVNIHGNCARDQEFILRLTNSEEYCGTCDIFSGKWIAGDEVEERCWKLGTKIYGHKGIFAHNKACQFYKPYGKNKISKKNEEKLEKMQKKGKNNLISFLEKAHLIEKVNK